jgi:hypothetical protein
VQLDAELLTKPVNPVAHEPTSILLSRTMLAMIDYARAGGANHIKPNRTSVGRSAGQGTHGS